MFWLAWPLLLESHFNPRLWGKDKWLSLKTATPGNRFWTTVMNSEHPPGYIGTWYIGKKWDWSMGNKAENHYHQVEKPGLQNKIAN